MRASEAAQLSNKANLTATNSQYQELMGKITAAATNPKGAKYSISVKGTILEDVKAQLIDEEFEVNLEWSGDRENGETITIISWKNAK